MTGIGEAAALATQPHPEPETPVPSLKLWQLTDEYTSVLEAVSENGGVLDTELEKRLDGINEAFDIKAERVTLWIRNLTSTAAGIKVEIERLAMLLNQNTKAADGLKDYLFRQLQAVGKTEVNRPLAKLKIVNNGGNPSIKYEGETIQDLPARYVSRDEVWSLNKAAHVTTKGAAGGDHDNLIPLCQMHHRLQHLIGIRAFAHRFGLRLKTAAKKVTALFIGKVKHGH